MQNDSFLRWREVQSITGLSKTTVWRLQKKGQFPKNYRLGENSVGIRASELAEWMQSRPIAGGQS